MIEKQQCLLEEFQKVIGYKFKNLNLLRQALTTPQFGNKTGLEHYEILETLGDAVIKTILISRLIRDKMGMLNSKIITQAKQTIENNETLSRIARDYFRLQNYVFKTKDQDLLGRDKKILADVLEALCGAIFLDCGSLKIVNETIINKFYYDWDNLTAADIFSKNKLNEYIQKKYKFNPEIIYEYERIGPDEDTYWIAKNPKILNPEKKVIYEFKGLKSKQFKKQKQAEQYLCSIMLQKIKKREKELF
ncbi:MAG: ribonuclease III domain-containing protein [Promethearchaeota archaeon]